jgi:hypothetical protein
MNARPLLRFAAGAVLAAGTGAACALLAHAFEHRVGLCPDSLVEGPSDAASPRLEALPSPGKTTARVLPDASPAR